MTEGKMNIEDPQETFERVDPEIRSRVQNVVKCLFDNASDFDEMTQILDAVETIVEEQIKKVDTKKFKFK
jgi:hypothetical protein